MMSCQQFFLFIINLSYLIFSVSINDGLKISYRCDLGHKAFN